MEEDLSSEGGESGIRKGELIAGDDENAADIEDGDRVDEEDEDDEEEESNHHHRHRQRRLIRADPSNLDDTDHAEEDDEVATQHLNQVKTSQ